MNPARLKQTTVIRYAHDGGYSPKEWQNALALAEFCEPIVSGSTQRVGVQITKTRTIDVVVRIELFSGLFQSIRAAAGRTRSDSLFKNPRKCGKEVDDAGRPLAVLGGKFGARSARVLVCAARDG